MAGLMLNVIGLTLCIHAEEKGYTSAQSFQKTVNMRAAQSFSSPTIWRDRRPLTCSSLSIDCNFP